MSLRVAAGEKVVVCGPSGSGKSTLIRCICRLERHERGRIVVDGVELDDDRARLARIRSEVGMVFQQFNLFPHLSVLENLTLAPVQVRGMARARGRVARDALPRAGAHSRAGGEVSGQLSGGQQQRVAIARSLCMRPKVMLFDEPTSALDPEMIREVLEVMEDLAREGMTMVCVTHEMGFARRVADTVVFMDGGRIVESAPAGGVLRLPQTERCRDFLGRILAPLMQWGERASRRSSARTAHETARISSEVLEHQERVDLERPVLGDVELVRAPGELLQADHRDERAHLQHVDELVAERRQDGADRLREDHEAERLPAPEVRASRRPRAGRAGPTAARRGTPRPRRPRPRARA